MAIHKIVRLGSPILRETSQKIPEQEFQSKSLKKLIRDMGETMCENNGAGLAAVQIGILKRIILVTDYAIQPRYPEISGKEVSESASSSASAAISSSSSTSAAKGESENHDQAIEESQMITHIMINPKIVHSSKETHEFWEGCLSIPNMRGLVERPKQVRIQYTDEYGQEIEKNVDGFQAIIVQHEIDHLNGALYVDRLKSSRLFGFCEELDAIQNSS